MNILERIHDDGTGNISWMRAACSLAVITGCGSIFIQLFMVCAVIAFTDKGLEQLQHIEWMQPAAILGLGLGGKYAQKHTEVKNGKGQ